MSDETIISPSFEQLIVVYWCQYQNIMFLCQMCAKTDCSISESNAKQKGADFGWCMKRMHQK